MTKFFSTAYNARRAGQNAAAKYVASGELVVLSGPAVAPAVTEENVKAFVVGFKVFGEPSPEACALLDGFDVTVDVPADKPAPVNAAKAAKMKVNHTPVEKLARSTIAKPVEHVFAVADRLYTADPKVSRKAILEQLRSDGVAHYTATTQYARWRTTHPRRV